MNVGVHLQLAGPLLLFAIHAGAEQSPTTNPAAYPGYTGDYPGFTLILDDRFDQFDADIWKKGDGAVGAEAACRFQAQGVQVQDGLLELVVRREFVAASWSEDHQQTRKDYQYSCGEIRTRPERRIRYGRVETRMKAPHRQVASGYISSLFTYTNETHGGHQREWEEIDIELEGIRPDKFQANLIYGLDSWEWRRTRDYGAWEDKIVVGPVDQWRVFAIEWLPDRISWYVDGDLKKTLRQADIDCVPNCVAPQKYPTPIPDNVADVMLNFWIPNDVIENEFGGSKTRNRYPMTTRYDWIRFYQYDAEPVANWQDRVKTGR